MEEKEQRNLQIFETFDGVVGAFLGTWGDNGLLLYRSGSGWEYHESGTKTWDGFHQILYRNHRAEILTLAELEERRIPAPPLDKYPDGTPGKAWADQFSAELPFRKVPKGVLERLKESSELYLVLQEDEYETFFGDGRYLYPVVAFWDENAAKKFIENRQKKKKTNKKTIQFSYKYAIKTIRVVADQCQKKLLADLNIGLYEHYSLKDVLSLLKYADFGIFEPMDPVIDEEGPLSGSVGDRMTIKGQLFSTKKPRVYLQDPVSQRRKRCKILRCTMEPTTGESVLEFVVAKVDLGSYSLILKNKIGEARVTFTVN